MNTELLKQKIKLYGQARIARESGINPTTISFFINDKKTTRNSTVCELEKAVKKIELTLAN